jgi:spermidine synthase
MKTLHRIRGMVHDLVVTQEGSTITLWSGPGIRHTVINLQAPHLPGLEYARNTLLTLAFNPRARSFLILGLGGGSIPRMLRAACPEATIEAVEIDPAVPEIARRFFQLGDSLRLEIHSDDAAAYVARRGRKYDSIVMDAYVGDAIPQQCTTGAFFVDVRESLTGEGVLAVNLMGTDLRRYKDLLSNIQASVGHTWLLRGNRSRNTLAFAPRRNPTRPDLLSSAAQLDRELPHAFHLQRLARRLQLWLRDDAC